MFIVVRDVINWTFFCKENDEELSTNLSFFGICLIWQSNTKWQMNLQLNRVALLNNKTKWEMFSLFILT